MLQIDFEMGSSANVSWMLTLEMFFLPFQTVKASIGFSSDSAAACLALRKGKPDSWAR